MLKSNSLRAATAAALAFAIVALGAALAIAAPCAERTEFLAYLDDKYEEAPISMGLMADGRVIEVLASEKGTWTIIVTKASGESCGFASGAAWMMKSPPADIGRVRLRRPVRRGQETWNTAIPKF